MSMDTWLAQAYNTNGASEDLEKIAQAEMAQNMAQQEGLDLSNLSPEQIEALGQEVLGPQGQGQQPQGAAPGAPQQPGVPQQGMQPQQPQAPGAEGGGELTEEHVQEAQQVLANPQAYDPAIVQEAQAIMQVVEQMQAQQAGQPGPEMAKVAEAQAKFEEADFLGRVMAHAFNQESEKIAASKQANMMGAAGGHLKHLGQQAAHHMGAAAGAAKHHAGKAMGAAGGHFAKHPGHAAAAGAVGGAAAMHGAHHMMNKEATVAAIEKAAMQQAANILQANGIDPATGQPAQQAAPQIAPAGAVPAPQQNSQQALGELVEKRAHQILRGLGYNI